MNEGQSPERRVVAVFDDAESARAAADAVRQAGIDDRRISVNGRDAEVDALRGEMREQMEHTIVGPGNVGPFTKEQTKGMVVGIPLATLIGAVLALPLALIRFADVPLVSRAIVAALVGAAAGATLGFVLGGGLRSKGPSRQMAAERGVVVSVDLRDGAEAARVAEVFEQRRPLRVDSVLPEGQPADTVTTEEEQEG